MAVTEVLTGSGKCVRERSEPWQFMKMVSVWHQMALRWEKRGEAGIGTLENIG
jgi:hypothetical protein